MNSFREAWNQIIKPEGRNMSAERMNQGKPELGYLLEFPTAIEAFARVKMLGAAKYERGNWKKGGKPDNEYLDACLRHLTAFANGEMFADDSACLHLAHAAWNLFALMELNYPGITHDKENFDKMIAEWTAKRNRQEQRPKVEKHTWHPQHSPELQDAFEDRTHGPCFHLPCERSQVFDDFVDKFGPGKANNDSK